jgi:carbamoyl-phosphate synthase large subunit
MRSTGEVMGLDWKRDGETSMAPAFARAFAKSQLGGGVTLPTAGTAFVSVKDSDKVWILEPVRLLQAAGFRVLTTAGTGAWLREQGVETELVRKVLEGRPHIVDAMKNGEVQLVFNTTEGAQSYRDSFSIRRSAHRGHGQNLRSGPGCRCGIEPAQAQYPVIPRRCDRARPFRIGQPQDACACH